MLANHTALVARDSREIPIEDSAAPILDAAGNVIGSGARVPRRHREAPRAGSPAGQRGTLPHPLRDHDRRLLARRDYLRRVWETMRLRYLAVNPAFEVQTGLKAEDILGRTTLELFPNPSLSGSNGMARWL